jgi:PAS domain-containing protein
MIQARSLAASLTTACFLVDSTGTLVFFNQAAGELLGLDFEEAGPMDPGTWGTKFRPRNPGGEELAVDELPLTIALRAGRPATARMEITSADGREQLIDVSALPIARESIQHGAIAIFWPVRE